MINTLKMLESTRHDFYVDFKSLFLYHTNKMEGSTFTQLELTTLINNDIIQGRHQYNDVVETKNSIELFDYLIQTLEEKEISKFFLREMHQILKKGTDDELNGFVGVFKPITNGISGVDLILAKPYEVDEKIENLLKLEINTIDDVAIFHKEFELIHPFTDGNGRIGRMIILKQCIENKIIPPLITDENAEKYKKAMYKSQKTGDNSYVVETFKEGQFEFENHEIFKNLVELDTYYKQHLSKMKLKNNI